MPNREEVYDAEIFPLMAKIIAICQQHEIALLASFAIPVPDNQGLRCTTVLLSDDAVQHLSAVSKNDFFAAKSMLVDGFVAWARTTRPAKVQ